jgi:hypothetical protein
VHNDPLLYGTDFSCLDDATDLYDEAVGLDVVRQSAYHRLTNDRILGEPGDPDCEEYGYDCIRLLGMTQPQLTGKQAFLSTVLQRDDRITGADVVLTLTENGDGTTDVLVEATCYTAAGPFKFVFPVSQLTRAALEPAA